MFLENLKVLHMQSKHLKEDQQGKHEKMDQRRKKERYERENKTKLFYKVYFKQRENLFLTII